MLQHLTLEKMISIIRNGLGKSHTPKKVIITGAGVSGLVAASLLKEAGHKVVVLEADNRVGGRILTIRQPFSEGLYFEAGAMRIPSSHYLVREYIRKFKLKTHPFINTTPNDLMYVNGIKARRWFYEQNPDLFGYQVAPHEKGKTTSELLESITKNILPLLTQYKLQDLSLYLDKYSLDSFLLRNPFDLPLSSGATEKLKVLEGLEGFSEYNILGISRDLMPWLQPKVDYYEIEGGMDRFPYTFFSQLKNEVRFNHKVNRIEHQKNEVSIYSTDTNTCEEYKVTGDFAIITIPFSALQLVDIEPRWAFSNNKRRAIRELRYLAATKIGMEFKSRFWENQGLLGGHSVTDLPSRFTYYPSHGIGSTGPATITGSYTLGSETVPWDSQSEEDRLQYLLRNLSSIHGDVVYDEFVTGVSVSWRQHPYIAGDLSVLKNEDISQIYPYLAAPEGRIHFAGEHTAFSQPTWIEGAVESGIRSAFEVHHSFLG